MSTIQISRHKYLLFEIRDHNYNIMSYYRKYQRFQRYSNWSALRLALPMSPGRFPMTEIPPFLSSKFSTNEVRVRLNRFLGALNNEENVVSFLY